MTTAPPDLHDRAAAILGTNGGDIRWPYGMSPAQRSITRDESAETYAERVQQQQAKQEAMVSWAEQYGLKYTPHGCCPAWLRGAVNRRCRPYRERAACTRYANASLDHDWLDHAVGWLKDGKPAVLTSAPYGLERISEFAERLAYWTQQDPLLKVVTGGGWYSPATTQIIVWRTDRIEDVQPATPPWAT
ncbi:hypothetical protein ACFVWR_18365 [Leifsonia sp. NPDC058292]|uniref:hypothetical protein n=1 Tax=Leifsonia sp. NPDC058292 TaxID=3346428 RepID=UPI0036D9019C